MARRKTVGRIGGGTHNPSSGLPLMWQGLDASGMPLISVNARQLTLVAH